MQAIAVFSDKKVRGTVRFSENAKTGLVDIDIDVEGLKKNAKHGFHVHECGDLTDGCESMCAHFNPYGKAHGGQDSKNRHVGDLGNLITDKDGCAKYRTSDHMIRLRGYTANIIGRGLVIHADEDDCGLGVFSDSTTTGHSGKRIACAVIGQGKPTRETLVSL